MSSEPQVLSNVFGCRPLDPEPRHYREPRSMNGGPPVPKPQDDDVSTSGTETRESSGRRTGLGRGLDSLIPSAPSEEPGPSQLRVPIGSIAPNPVQPRQDFDEAQLNELADSIRQHGMLQPLLVRPEERGRYELIAGERRWRAAGRAGLESVPIVVYDEEDDDDDRGLTLALVENLQRADLNPIETATAFEQLSASGWSQERIAAEVGRSRSAVANLLRLLRLSGAIQDLVATGVLSEGHARALLGAPESVQEELADRAIERSWTVRQLEAAVKALATPQEPAEDRTTKPSRPMLKAVQRLESALGTRVEVRASVKGAQHGGRIVIHWYDEEQLGALAAQMSGAVALEDESGEDFGV